MKKYNIIFLLISVNLSCNNLHKPESSNDICFFNNFSQKVEKVSLKDVESIKKLNGKFVEIDGVFHYNFEDVALYPSTTADAADAVWLDLTNYVVSNSKKVENINGKIVTVLGKVNIFRRGHSNTYIATLDSTFCIKEKENK